MHERKSYGGILIPCSCAGIWEESMYLKYKLNANREVLGVGRVEGYQGRDVIEDLSRVNDLIWCQLLK